MYSPLKDRKYGTAEKCYFYSTSKSTLVKLLRIHLCLLIPTVPYCFCESNWRAGQFMILLKQTAVLKCPL